MPVTYKNKEGQCYYLHKKITKRHNFRYYFSKNNSVNLVDNIPDNYEIYENPVGQVFLRKKSKNFIRDKDIKIVEQVIAEKSDFEHFYINCNDNKILIYLPDLDIEEIDGMLNVTMDGDQIKLEAFNPGNLTYSPYLRITYNKDRDDYLLEKIDQQEKFTRWEKLGQSPEITDLITDNINKISNPSYSKLKILFL